MSELRKKATAFIRTICKDEKKIEKILNSMHKLIDSNDVPSQYRERDKPCAIKINHLCRGLKFLSDFELGDTYLSSLWFVGNKLSLTSSIALAIGLRGGHIKTVDEFLFDEKSMRISEANKNLNSEPQGACCRIKRREGVEMVKVFTISDAKKAGLIGKGVWAKYPSDMLGHRARTRAIASACPDLFSDIQYTDEMSYEDKFGKANKEIEVKELKEDDSEYQKVLGEGEVSNSKKPTLVVTNKNEESPAIEDENEEEKSVKAPSKPKDVALSPTTIKFDMDNSTFEEKVFHFRNLESQARERGLVKKETIITKEDLENKEGYSVIAYINRVTKLLKSKEDENANSTN